MTREIEQITDKGMIHEGPETNDKAAEILAKIAALPLEGSSDTFAGREHDSILYPKK